MNMIDHIVSRRGGEVYATVEFIPDEKIDFFFRGRLLRNDFPAELLALVAEYEGIVEDMVFSLVDEVEERIYAYDLGLREMGVGVFNLSIGTHGEISFFTKYPTGSGFKDRYPG
jgi:glutamine synthetase type III